MTGKECVAEILNTVDVEFEMIDGTIAHKAVTHLTDRIDKFENGIDIEHEIVAMNLTQSKHISTLTQRNTELEEALSDVAVNSSIQASHPDLCDRIEKLLLSLTTNSKGECDCNNYGNFCVKCAPTTG